MLFAIIAEQARDAVSKPSKVIDARWRTLICAAAVASTTALVFSGVVEHDFVHWDDPGHVLNDPYLRRLTPSNLAHFWMHPYEHLYIPLSYMVFALLTMLARIPTGSPRISLMDTVLNPHVFHGAGLLLHVVNAVIVFDILRRLTKRTAPSTFGALLFALHPMQVESVAWISEIRGLLSSLFALIAIDAYVTSTQSGSEPTPSQKERESRRLYVMALVAAVPALLCKPSAVCLAPAIFALAYWGMGLSLRSAVKYALPFLVIAIPFIWVTHAVQPVDAGQSGTLWQRPLIAGDALAFYLVKLLDPTRLTIDYGRRPDVVLSHPEIYFAWLLPAAIGVVAFTCRRRYPLTTAACGISLSMLLPVLGLTPFAYQDHSTVADRYVYLAMLGPALFLSAFLAEFGSGVRRASYALSAILLAACAALSIAQIRHWTNSLTLFQYAVAMNPSSYGLRTNYGVSLYDQDRYVDAIAQYQAAIRLDPSSPDAYEDMGVSLDHLGRVDEAVDQYRAALRIAPNFPLAHLGLGIDLAARDLPSALTELCSAVDLAPDNPTAHAKYGIALAQAGQIDEARAELDRALAIDPENAEALGGKATLDANAGDLDNAITEYQEAVEASPADARNHAGLAEALEKNGRLDEAVAEFRKAAALDPTAAAVHYALGFLLFRQGDRAHGIEELRQSAQLTPTAPHVDTLGVAYATVGNMVGAKSAFEEALRLDPSYDPSRRHLHMLSE